MGRKDRRRKQSRTQQTGGRSKSRPPMVFILSGVILIGLAAGLVFVYGRNPTSDRNGPLGIEIASLPPLSTQGTSIRGWHDMANLPNRFKGPPLPKDQPQPDVAVKPAIRYLGAVSRKDVVNLDYVVVNVGDQDLVIDNVVTSCGCTTATLSHNIIPPGRRADLAVRFDAGYHQVDPGKRVVRAVWLMTNDPDTPVAEVRLTASIQ